MTDYTLATTMAMPYDEALPQVRSALEDAGFGVLTEIDVSATLRKKLGVDTPPRIILGACRPELAHVALQADPRVAALLPCNVVVASSGPESTTVTALDPEVMRTLSDHPGLTGVVSEARQRIDQMLSNLAGAEPEA